MKPPSFAFIVKLALLFTMVIPSRAMAAGPTVPRESVSPAFQEAIAGMPGKTVTALMVNYPPGGKSRPHRHGAAFVVAYVLSGSIRSQIDDHKARIYQAGEHWTETPGAHHRVSENASATKPAKLLAIFVADTKQKSLVVWDQK